MPESEEISASVGLDTTEYERSIRRGIRAADDFDAALAALVDEANDAEKAINKLDSDIKLEIDANLSSLLDADRLIQALDTTISPLVDIQVSNDATVRQLLDDFNATLNPKLNFDDSELVQAQQLLDKLNANITTDINVESSEVEKAKRQIDALDSETLSLKVNADTSELGDIKKQLEDLKALAVIDLVLKLPGMAEGLGDLPLLGAASDQDKAKRIITAGTGGGENADFHAAASEKVYADNFGADRQETAKAYTAVVTAAADETGRLATTGENLGTITEQTFTTAANTGADFNEVLLAESQLVKNGLAPSFEAASDMINKGFAEGLNASGDFLETITEYSPYFAKAGFSAEEMFSTFKTGTDAGIRNLDLIGDLVKELDIRLQSAASGEGVEFDAFKKAGLADLPKAYVAGQATGAEALRGLTDAWASGKIDPQVLFDALGTQAEDITIPVVVKLDPIQAKEEFAQLDGTTVEVAAQLGGDLGSSIEAAKRKIESEVATSFSTALDIPGKIQQLSDGVSKMSSLIDLGATIPEAIEVAFQLPGFAEGVDMLASTMGNLGITFMELVASVLDALGKGDAAGTVRGTIAQAAETQLAFDLKLANDGTDFSNAIKLAAERGVSEADLQQAIMTGGQELIDAGDMTGAQAYLAALQDMATIELSPELTKFLTGQGIDVTNLDAVKTKLQEFTASPSGANPFASQFGSGGEFQTAFEDAQEVLGGIDYAAPAKEALAPLKLEFTAAEEAATKNLENMKLAAQLHLPGIAEVATSTFTPMQAQITGTDEAFTNMTIGMATDTASMGTTLATANSNATGFGDNSQYQFGEVTVGALDSADLKMQAFGVTVTNTMLQANADVQALIDKLLSIGGLDITLPPVGGGGGPATGPGGNVIGPAPMSGGQPIIPGQSVGGSIEAGTLGKVHAEELLYAGSEDISVLNRQTSSVIDNALSALIGGGGGGNVTNVYNVTNNVVINPGGAAAMSAAMDSKAIRGF